jgi:alpha-L-fucosidase
MKGKRNRQESKLNQNSMNKKILDKIIKQSTMAKIITHFFILVMILANHRVDGQGAAAVIHNTETKVAGNKSHLTKWFTHDRFGMFIHWGAYAVPAKGEWAMHKNRIPYKEYEQIAKSFKPEDFDAAKIVKMAKDAGMKYVVITAKHHDGFAMWDSKLTDYNIVKWSHFKRDPLKELAVECKKQGMKLGFYYSVRDWHHPDFVLHYEHLNGPGPNYKGWYAFPVNWTGGKVMDCGCSACVENLPITKEQDPRKSEAEGADMNRYLDYMKGQIRELLTNYGPIAVMWFDGQDIVDNQKGRVQEMINEMRRLQPNVLINDRIAWDPGMGDYGVSEGKIPGSTQVRPWETCMTLTNTGDWGYTPTTNFKSTKEIIHNLADIVSKGGNFLLNIAPNGQGVVSNQYRSLLDSIGHWMTTNGGSIYGCQASNLTQPKWGRITVKGDKMYLHVFDWPASRRITVDGLKQQVNSAYVLSNKKQKLQTRQSNEGTIVLLPSHQPNAINSVIVLKLK